MKCTKTYYHNGKFLFLEGEWPEKPPLYFSHYTVGGKTAETGSRAAEIYSEALSSALEKAVEFEDQNAIYIIVQYHNKHIPYQTPEGLYTIPETEAEIVTASTAVLLSDGTILRCKLARIIPQQKEELTASKCLNELVHSVSEGLKESSNTPVIKDNSMPDFAILKYKIGETFIDYFLQYNEGKFHTPLELNPAVHAVSEHVWQNYVVPLQKENEELKANYRIVRELLPVMHADGGHYVEKHGVEKATEDAIEIYYKLRSDKEELLQALKEVFNGQYYCIHGDVNSKLKELISKHEAK